MKERPILFSGPMVRLILGDHKTQTRRVIKPQPISVKGGYPWKDDLHAIICPFGRSGDRLWVRETFVVDYEIGEGTRGEVPPAVFYRATDDGKTNFTPGMEMWKPSIHMPRWTCRLFLDVKAIRVERLQDISEDDCYSEGALEWADAQDLRHSDGTPAKFPSIRHAYRALWDSLNAKRGFGWDTNPWVWMIEFKRTASD